MCPESKWLRIFTDGPLQDSRVGVHCKHFPQYIVLEEHANHHDGELVAMKTFYADHTSKEK